MVHDSKGRQDQQAGEAGLPIGESRGETHHSYPCDITSSTAIGGISGTVPERSCPPGAHIAVCRWEHRRHDLVSPRPQRHPFLCPLSYLCFSCLLSFASCYFFLVPVFSCSIVPPCSTLLTESAAMTSRYRVECKSPA